ncbi:MAG: hypothetical protein CSA34_06765 [Desulfobulbus propionicus]|nr:MAG: hypothetical protein CSA34_06765 [Desulfobulbus propionicus]
MPLSAWRILLTAFLILVGLARGAAATDQQHPWLSDDMRYRSLSTALEQSLGYLRQRSAETTFTLGNRQVSRSHLVASLQAFRRIALARPSTQRLNILLSRYFVLYKVGGPNLFPQKNKVLVTGYYQPIIKGCLQRKPPYIHPLFAVPDDLAVRHHSPHSTVGRLEGAAFSPYWSRAEIETQGKAKGHELVWLGDPFDAFNLHIQGSGLVSFPDGSTRGVHYASSNGHPYRSIGRYMVETGKMRLEEVSMSAIRHYLDNHPEERETILEHNPSFIFFEWSDAKGAIGNLGKELVAGRSIAVDQHCFPPAALGFLRTRKPLIDKGRVVNWVDLERFVTVHDTGSAIRGPQRLDLYWGTGEQAGLAAGHMKENGTLYFLLLKEGLRPENIHL